MRKSKVPYQPLKGRALHDATNRLILSEPEKILGDNAPHDKECVVPAKRPAKDEDAPIPIDPVLLEGDTLVDDDEDVLDFDQLVATEAENFDVPVDTDVVDNDDGKERGTLLSRVSEYIFDYALEDDSKETGEDVLNVLELAFQRLHVTPTMQITKPITEFLPDEWCAKLFTINIVMDSDLSRGSGKNPPPE
ncbi:hypothetical protein LTR93_005135 [Exophiala xenobiotica]|nr:hypothetical protein LTR93_005135 [Exophiala xenobiotica]